MIRAVVALVLVRIAGPLLWSGAWLMRLANRIDGPPWADST